MRNLFLAGIVLVGSLGCGGVTTVDNGSGGAGGAKGSSSTGASTTSSNTSTSASSASTTSASVSSSSSTGGGACSPACGFGFSCCGGVCVNETNDILNCGTCGNECSGSHPFCNAGTCGDPPCTGVDCSSSELCCGTHCCTTGMLCCDVPEGVDQGPQCTAPVNGTCPLGCPACL